VIRFFALRARFGLKPTARHWAGAGFVEGTIAPDVAERNIGVIGFSALLVSNRIGLGETSNVLIVSTNTLHFKLGNAEVLDGGSVTVKAFQPGIPEPATMALLGGGLLVLAGIRKYRR
jgi:hypothetical protein